MTFEHVVAYAESLKEVGFRITKLDPPRWVDMSWRVGTRTIDAALFCFGGADDKGGYYEGGDYSAAHFALNVDDLAFLEFRLSFESRDDPELFEAYVQAQRVLVARARPLIGIIDDEVDFDFDAYGAWSGPFFGWGMFFSQTLMAAKPQMDWAALKRACGDYEEGEDGLQVFVDPLESYTPEFTPKQLLIRSITSALGPGRDIIDRNLWLKLTQWGGHVLSRETKT